MSYLLNIILLLMIDGSKTECPSQEFGEDCANKCHCLDAANCTKNGICPGGCAAGYQGPNCEDSCGNGTYGQQCAFKCGQCLDDTPCDHVTGRCTSTFKDRFNRDTSSEDLLQSLNGTATLTMSSIYSDWKVENSIDQIYTDNPDTCHCCAGTNNDVHSWWRVDLGKKYPLSNITVYSRKNELTFKHLSGFNLVLKNNSIETGLTMSMNTAVTFQDFVEINVRNTLAQIVEIQRPGRITLCEVLVNEGDCAIGRFGDECSKRCHCADEKACERINGTCQIPICKIGYIGVSCNEECPLHHFGEGCLKQCFCAKNRDCTKDYGICPLGCAQGYEGAHCESACQNGRYGFECSEICGKCLNQQACDHVTGRCENGCREGYLGKLCKEALNLLENIHPNITMSQTYMDWDGERVIDGNEDLNPVECQCCSSTLNQAKSWLRIDLGHLYPLKNIIIFGRKNEKDYYHLQGFTLYLKNDSSTQNSPFYENTNMTMDYVDILVPNVLTKIIEIVRKGKLTICEVKVFEGECETGRYSDECSKYCYCKDKIPCDKIRCSAGWIGEACDEECPRMFYGKSCAFECGNCAGDTTCNSITGHCASGCSDGYTGDYCKDPEAEDKTGLIVGLSVGLALFVIIACFCCCWVWWCWCHRRNDHY